jgi:two-component system OmpR family sensor kinase
MSEPHNQDTTPAAARSESTDVAAYSLRRRLLWLLGLAIIVVALLQAALAYRAALAQADAAFDAQMKQLAMAIRAGQFDPSQPRRTAEELDFVVQAWSADGRIVYQSTRRRIAPAQRRPGYSIAKTGDKTYRVYATDQRGVSVQVSQDLDARASEARREAIKRTWPIALLGPLLVLLAGWVISRSLAPVERLRHELSQRKPGQLESIDETDLPAEVKPLVSELNGLFDRVSTTMQAQQNFVADAAHELRSPLTAVKLQLRNVRQAMTGANASGATSTIANPDAIDGLQRLEQGIDRAARMTDQLISMAQQEALTDIGPAIPVNLGELVRETIVQLNPQATERQIDLGLYRDESLEVNGWPDALQILLRNLVSNAIKYSPQQGTVDVSVVRENGQVCLVVEDTGPGIEPAQRKRVLDRFHRGRSAQRSNDDDPGTGTLTATEAAPQGSGLGLAIVKTISDRHHATLQLARSPRLGGLRVTVAFPAYDVNR